MERKWQGKIGFLGTITLLLLLIGAAVQAAPPPITGTYRFVNQEAAFWKYTGGDGGPWIYDITVGKTMTITFNGAGVCSLTSSGTVFEVGFSNPGDGVNEWPETESIPGCAYTVGADGRLLLQLEEDEEQESFEMWASPNGQVIVFGSTETEVEEEDGVDYAVDQFVGVKTGTTMKTASLAGTYTFTNQENVFRKFVVGGEVRNELYAGAITASFNGAGSCSMSYTGSGYEVPYGTSAAVHVESDSGTLGSCTYTVSAQGVVQMTFTDEGETEVSTAWLSADRNVLLAGGGGKDADSERTKYFSDQMVGVKKGSGMTLSALSGTFRLVSQELTFRDFTQGGVYKGIWGGDIIATFNGAGGCSITYNGNEYEVGVVSPAVVTSWPGSGAFNCTYTVTSQGRVSITIAGESEPEISGWLSANGYAFVSGGPSQDIDDERVKYLSDQLVGVKAGTYVEWAAVSEGVTVPATDADGGYPVRWEASSTPDATYVLQEARDSAFSIGVRTAYTGTALKANITGRASGKTYYYRVKVTKVGSADSPWLQAGNGCAVTIKAAVPATLTVPATDADGSYTVSWEASATANATYVLQEATNATFTTGVRTVYTGNALQANITSRASGTTYYYRVKARKTAYADSAWRNGANGCSVRCALPGSLSVPAASSTGSYEVRWGASDTDGVSYMLQEARNATFTVGVRTAYTGAALKKGITGRVSGQTYYYRVKAMKDGYPDSPWRKAVSGCAVQITP